LLEVLVGQGLVGIRFEGSSLKNLIKKQMPLAAAHLLASHFPFSHFPCCPLLLSLAFAYL